MRLARERARYWNEGGKNSKSGTVAEREWIDVLDTSRSLSLTI